MLIVGEGLQWRELRRRFRGFEKASSESVRTLPALRVSKELMLEDILIDR